MTPSGLERVVGSDRLRRDGFDGLTGSTGGTITVGVTSEAAGSQPTAREGPWGETVVACSFGRFLDDRRSA
jgi:hypothetical protein